MVWAQDAVLPAAVVDVFAIKGQDVYILRDENYQPIRIGKGIIVLQGKDVLRVDLGEDSPERAVKWRAAIETTPEEVLRTIITPGEHITVGRSRDGKTIAIATPTGVTALDLAIPSTELLSLSRGEPAAPSLMASELELKSGELLAGTVEPDELEIRTEGLMARLPIADVKLLEHLGGGQVKAQLWDGKQVQGSLVTRLTMCLGQGLRIPVEPLDLVRITRRTPFSSKEQFEAMVSQLGSYSYQSHTRNRQRLCAGLWGGSRWR